MTTGWTPPEWPGDDWEDHCGDPDCDICHGDIPSERLGLFLRWKAMQGRDILMLCGERVNNDRT